MQNIFIDVLPPWVETGLQPAFYDLESGTVLQQTARMYAKVRELTEAFNTFTTNVTNEINQFEEDTNDEIERFEGVINDTVEEYIEKFNDLHDYVQDYFDNLDVQEEINNKLDDMVEAGTLQEIITTYIQANVEWTFDSVAEMQSATNLISGSYAETLGYYAKGDGGGALYYITDTQPSGLYYESLTDLYAVLVPKNNAVNILQLGAKSDKSADISSIISGNQAQFDEIFIPEGSYLLSDTVTITSPCNIICDDNAWIYPSISDNLFKIKTEFHKYKLNIDGTDQPSDDTTKYAVTIGADGFNARHTNLSFSKFKNLRTSGICWEQGAFANFTNLYMFTVKGYGIYCTGNYDDNNHGIFTNTELIYTGSTGLLIAKGATEALGSRHHIFSNMKFFGCAKGLEIQTHSNMGSLFFEKCSADHTTNTNCCELTSDSKGNKIEIINDVNVWQNLADNGTGNLVCGYTNYGFYSYKDIRANSVKIHKENMVGRQEFTQTTTNESLDTITDTTAGFTVRHNKGTAYNRTDLFENKVQIGDYRFTTAKTGVIDLSGDLAAGATQTYTVPSSSSFASSSNIPTVWTTFFLPNGFDTTKDVYMKTYMVGATIICKVVNASASTISLDNGKIRWSCITHS